MTEEVTVTILTPQKAAERFVDRLVLVPVSRERFVDAIARARLLWSTCREATSRPEEMPQFAAFYLTDDLQSGFGVNTDGELFGVFSLERGRGDALVRTAIKLGATRLDCFEGYLSALYARHGFVEYDRRPNWTEGGPDVVWMRLPGSPG